MSFTDLQTKRRSIYALGRQVTQTPEALYDLVKSAVKQSPTSFNNQSVRAVVLMGDAHEKLWDMTAQRLQQGELDTARELYAQMGDVYRQLPSWSKYILTSDLDFENAYGEKVTKRRKLYNGALRVDYFQYWGKRAK